MSKKEFTCEWCNITMSRKWDLERHQTTKKCEKAKKKKMELKQIIMTDSKIKEIKGDLINNINNGNENNITNNINKNITNILKFSPDLSIENMKRIAKLITPEILMDEFGLVKLYEKQIARNELGEYGMVNSNKRNPLFNYKDKDGNICRKNATYIMEDFDEYTESEINKNLKTVKKLVKD